MHSIRPNVNNNLRNANICKPNYTPLTIEQEHDTKSSALREQAHHYKKSEDEKNIALEIICTQNNKMQLYSIKPEHRNRQHATLLLNYHLHILALRSLHRLESARFVHANYMTVKARLERPGKVV
jgi:hypothetical protein